MLKLRPFEFLHPYKSGKFMAINAPLQCTGLYRGHTYNIVVCRQELKLSNLSYLVFITLVPLVDLCISLYQNLDELKQKLGLVQQITTEETLGDYSYYEFNDVDVLNATRTKRVNILIEMMELGKIQICDSQFILSFSGSCCEYKILLL